MLHTCKYNLFPVKYIPLRQGFFGMNMSHSQTCIAGKTGVYAEHVLHTLRTCSPHAPNTSCGKGKHVRGLLWNICIFAIRTDKPQRMTIIDIIILVFIVLGMVPGFMKGAIRQMAGLLGLVLGLVAARTLYTSVAEEVFSHVTDNMTLAQVLSFVAIWMAVPLLFLLVASVLTRTLEAISLGCVNRLLGAVLGGLIHALVVSLTVGVLEHLDTNNSLIGKAAKQQSVLYYRIKPLAGMFLPTTRQLTEQLYNEINDATKRI